MDGYPCRDRRISRSFDEGIGFLEGLSEVWVVVHISEPIGIREECEPWRRDFLVRIEIPVIVVDIIRTVVEDIPLIESKGDDTPWKSPIRTDLITILIEYYISFWSFMPEECEDLLSIFLIESEDS